jgi:hypothetical protein
LLISQFIACVKIAIIASFGHAFDLIKQRLGFRQNPAMRRTCPDAFWRWRGGWPMSLRSSLGPIAPLGRDPDPLRARAAAREAWQRHGLILINPDWLASWTDRKQAELLAEALHGRRTKT